MKKLFTILLSVLMVLSLVNASAFAATDDNTPTETPSKWEVSKSKTATELDDDYVSEVTLSLPAAEEKLVSDVVIVADYSEGRTTVKAQVADLMEQLLKQIESTTARVNIGVIVFRGIVEQTFELRELTPELVDEYRNKTGELYNYLDTKPATEGSNLQCGLVSALDMIKNSSTPSHRQYVILVTDGITYTWSDGQTQMGVAYQGGDQTATYDDRKFASNTAWDVWYGNIGANPNTFGEKEYPYTKGKTFAGFIDFLDDSTVREVIEKTIAEKATPYDRKNIQNPVDQGDRGVYIDSCTIAMAKALDTFREILATGCNVEIIPIMTNKNQYGPQFMTELVQLTTSKKVNKSISDIKNHIFYLLDKESYVEDFIGYKENDYDFDFVDEASEITLTVGETTLTTELVDGVYTFTNPDTKNVDFTLEYTKGNGTTEEHFVLTANVPVSQFEPVQLTYKVQLTNPKKTAGVYGVYDKDGSNKENGLYTNNSATLYPVDTNGEKGTPEDFAKPTVSYKLVQVSVTKEWDDDTNRDGVRPGSVMVKLYANGVDTEKTVELSSERNQWTGVFDGLPYLNGGEPVEYTISEVTVEEYKSTVVVSDDGYAFTLTNTHTPATTEVTVTKTWSDSDNQDGLRDSYGVTLYANGKEYRDEVTLKADELTYTWNNLPVNADGKEIVYTVVETTVPEGYKSTVEGFKITNTHTPATTEVTVTKTWSDSDNQDGLRGEYGVTLFANGKEYRDEVTLKADELTYTWKDLPVNADGKKIEYTVVETTVPEGYEASVDGLTITNTHEAETTELTVTKVWVDADNKDKLRPESVKVTVYADGKELTTVELSEENKWTVTVEDLPVYANGKEVVYSVSEEEVEGYETEIESSELKFKVTNVHVIVPDTDPDDPEPTPEPTPTPVPDTGDAVNLVALYSMMASSAAGIVVTKALRKKYED